eukprot:3849067-Rhodomonas_salina.1
MSEEADKRLVIGATAKVKGLKGAPEHNGCIGQLLEFVEEKGRWQIKLSNNGLVLGVKPANLDFVRAPEPDVDDQDDMEGALMQRTKRKFDRILTVAARGSFSEDKAGEIADLLTGSDESVSRVRFNPLMLAPKAACRHLKANLAHAADWVLMFRDAPDIKCRLRCQVRNARGRGRDFPKMDSGAHRCSRVR